ncbi:hypothetical protein THAOC_15358, partial [Thalassiosira oceanica]
PSHQFGRVVVKARTRRPRSLSSLLARRHAEFIRDRPSFAGSFETPPRHDKTACPRVLRRPRPLLVTIGVLAPPSLALIRGAPGLSPGQRGGVNGAAPVPSAVLIRARDVISYISSCFKMLIVASVASGGEVCVSSSWTRVAATTCRPLLWAGAPPRTDGPSLSPRVLPGARLSGLAPAVVVQEDQFPRCLHQLLLLGPPSIQSFSESHLLSEGRDFGTSTRRGRVTVKCSPGGDAAGRAGCVLSIARQKHAPRCDAKSKIVPHPPQRLRSITGNRRCGQWPILAGGAPWMYIQDVLRGKTARRIDSCHPLSPTITTYRPFSERSSSKHWDTQCQRDTSDGPIDMPQEPRRARL